MGQSGLSTSLGLNQTHPAQLNTTERKLHSALCTLHSACWTLHSAHEYTEVACSAKAKCAQSKLGAVVCSAEWAKCTVHGAVCSVQCRV